MRAPGPHGRLFPALVLLVPVTLLAAFAAWTWQAARSDADQRADRAALTVAEHARRVLETQEAVLEAALSRVRGLSSEQIAADRGLHEFLVRLEKHIGSASAISLIDGQSGRMLSSSLASRPPGVDLSQRDYVKAHRQRLGGSTFIGEVVRGLTTGKVGFTVSRRDEESGIIAATLVPLDGFLSFYSGARQAWRDAMTLAREDGTALVIQTAADPVGFRLSEDSALMRWRRGELTNPGFARSAVDGVGRIWAFHKVGDHPVIALYGFDHARLVRDWLQQLVPFAFITLAGMAALLLAGNRAQRAVAARQRAEIEVEWASVRAAQADALRASEERLRLFIEHAPAAIAMLDRNMRYIAASRRWREDYGLGEQPLAGRCHYETLPETGEAWKAAHRRALAGAVEKSEGQEFRRADGRTQWLAWEVRPWRRARGEIGGIMITTRDITELKKREEHVRLLMREINHRSKNMLALVQAIARQTAASDAKDFALRFSQRIQALSASQDLVVSNEWSGVQIEALIHSQLAHFSDLIGNRIRLTGPPIVVTAAAAQAIGMAMHELATNAGKYGALSNASGQVAVSWRLEPAGGCEGRFALSWTESGGPPVAPPTRRGFGSVVTTTMVEIGLGAQVQIDYAPEGIVWQLECSAGNVC